MKLFWTLNVFLLAALMAALVGVGNNVVHAQQDEQQQEKDSSNNCDQVCRDLFQTEKEELIRERDAAVRDKDEIWHQREGIVREKDEFWHEKERALQDLVRLREELDAAVRSRDEVSRNMESAHEEKGGAVREVEELRAALDKQRDEMAHYQKVAQDNQKYMQEYKNQLHSQRDRAAKLDQALSEANAKIEELESTTFIKQLQKEISGAWKAIIEYWMNLKNKGKGEGNSDL